MGCLNDSLCDLGTLHIPKTPTSVASGDPSRSSKVGSRVSGLNGTPHLKDFDLIRELLIQCAEESRKPF